MSETSNEICQLHNKKVEAYCKSENALLCIDCMKGDFWKKERVPLSDISFHLIDDLEHLSSSIDEQMKGLETDKFIVQDKECRETLRNFFKGIHEALYDIERSKEQDLNLILGNLLGQF